MSLKKDYQPTLGEEVEVIIVKSMTGQRPNGRPMLPIGQIFDADINTYFGYRLFVESTPEEIVRTGESYICRVTHAERRFGYCRVLRKMKQP